MRVLFTNAGRRTYLIEYMLELGKHGYDIEIFVGDADKNSAAFYVSKKIKTIITPRVSGNEDHYIESLCEFVKENKIDIIIPLMDFELPILAAHKETFKKIGTTVIISDSNIINTTLDKYYTYNLCKKVGISFPKVYLTYLSIPKDNKIIRKKRLGSGSVGLSVHKNKSTLLDFKEGIDIAQCFIEGDEYGLDILNNLKGEFVHASFRKKIAMRAGETDKALIMYSDDLWDFAQNIGSKLNHIGNLDLDIIIDRSNKIHVIDINPRFGGGYPFSHSAGFNYLKAIIDDYLGKELCLPRKVDPIIGMKGINLFYYKKSNVK
jgi:carbamoyl-phosphate synthase large subunit